MKGQKKGWEEGKRRSEKEKRKKKKKVKIKKKKRLCSCLLRQVNFFLATIAQFSKVIEDFVNGFCSQKLKPKEERDRTRQ